jgi:hypothetical protein
LVVLAIVAALGMAFVGYGYDDPYITYRYTYNLIQGQGFVYNVGERVLSTTAAGYALLLAVPGLIYPDIPLWGNILSAVGLGLGAWSFYRWSAREGEPLVGVVAGLLLLTFPLCITSFGSEMCAYVGTTLAGFYAYARRRPERALAWMAAATMIRPDGALAAALIVMDQLVREHKVAWKAIALYLAILLPWVVYATWAFGSPIPVTLGAKQAQGQMEISESYLLGAWQMLKLYLARPIYWLYLALGGVGLWRLVRQGDSWWPLLLWTASSFLAYAILDVSRYFWYYVPLVPGVMLAVSAGMQWIHTVFARWPAGRRYRGALTSVLLVVLLWANVPGLRYPLTEPDPRLALYRETGQWLRAHTPEQASVGTLEVGILGYYAQRRIVDFAGLLQPHVQAQMDAKATYQDTARWAIEQYRPDYLALYDHWFSGSQAGLLAHCQPQRQFSQPRGPLFTVYECDWTD